MKKLILIILAILPINLFAQNQIIRIDRNVVAKHYDYNFWGEIKGTIVDRHIIYLSNGDILTWGIGHWRNESFDYVHATFIAGKDYPTGTLVYKAGNNYEVVNLQKKGVYTIKKANTHNVSSEFVASLNGDFSYGGFLGFHGGNGQISAKASGGTRTIVNLFFENGKTATIEASKEPIWLDVEAGMKVEHYTYKSMNIYKLL